MLHPAVTRGRLSPATLRGLDKDLTIPGMLWSCPAMQARSLFTSTPSRPWFFIKAHGESELPALLQGEGISSCCSPDLRAAAAHALCWDCYKLPQLLCGSCLPCTAAWGCPQRAFLWGRTLGCCIAKELLVFERRTVFNGL